MTIRAPIYTRIERAGSAVALLQLEPQDRLLNLLKSKDTFFGPAGCPPDYDWPNPRGPEYPVSLRTWITPLSLELRSKDKQFGGPGDWQTYDYPNPRGAEYPIGLRTWITPVSLELLSKDKQFGAAGDWQSYDYPNPIIRDAGIRGEVQANRLLDLLARPLVPNLFANPVAPQAWMLDQQGNLLVLNGVVVPPAAADTSSNAGHKKKRLDDGWRAFTEYREAIQALRREAAKQRPKTARVVQALAQLEAAQAPSERLSDLDQIRTGALSQEAIRALHALYRRWQDEDDEDDIEMLLLS